VRLDKLTYENPLADSMSSNTFQKAGARRWLTDPVDITCYSGLRLLLARRPGSPIVELRLILEGGFAGEPNAQSGLGGLAMAMLTEGALRVDGTPLALMQESLGAIFHGRITADAAIIGMSALRGNYADALAIFCRLIANPEFNPDDFDRIRATRLALIQRERLEPLALAMRVLPPMLYGADHVYARPFSGSGTERAVAALTADELRAYYSRHLVAEGSTLVATGSCEAAELIERLDASFKKGRVDKSPAIPMAAAGTSAPTVMIIDRPGSPRAWLVAGLPTLARNSPAAEALMVADAILGGMFTSHLNLSLREEKGWTYGVRSSLLDARLKGLWLIRAAVSNDHAVRAMAEIAAEIDNLARSDQCRRDEFDSAVDYLVARIPSLFETCAQMADALADGVINGLPTSYHRQLPSSLRRVSPNDVTESWRQILEGGALRWMIAADANAVLDQLSQSGFRIQIVHPSDELP
jgi:zinc protease